MKKLFTVILATVLILSCVPLAGVYAADDLMGEHSPSTTQSIPHADEITDETVELTYTLSDDGKSYAVTGCDTLASGAVNVPLQHMDIDVTAIADKAFFGCRSITVVSLSDNIVTIGNSAFAGCTGLNTIGFSAFLTEIGESAFSGCTSLKNVTIPATVQTVAANAFVNCTSLEGIFLDDGVKSVGEKAFYNCKNAVRAKIPASVETIGKYAFGYCENGGAVKQNAFLIYCAPDSEGQKYATDNGFTNYSTLVGADTHSNLNIFIWVGGAAIIIVLIAVIVIISRRKKKED